jgi:hydroxycarboxylate dehydrogenase B
MATTAGANHMSIIKPPAELQDLATRCFDAAGSPHEESAWVAETLVRANLMGHDSHGILRVPFYVDRIRTGELRPGAPLVTERETGTMAVLNAGQGWGQVAAREATRLAIAKARTASLGMVAIRDCQHTGRAGEWVEMAAREGMIGLAFVNSRGGGGQMAPWGGIDRRLKLDPMAFAAPSGGEFPVLVDVTMAALSGGKIHVALAKGDPLPEGCLIDAEGNPTTDAADFDGPPPGAVLPLGGILGHKGYALTVMVDLLAGALTGAGVSGQQTPTGNGVVLQAINIADFRPLDEFIGSVDGLRAWVKSSRREPGVEEILFPGEIEYRTAQRRAAEGIPVPEATWAEVVGVARELGVEV